MVVAPMILVRYPDRARVLQFLQDRIEEADTSKANYYQVVGLMHAVEMGPLLRKLESLEAKLKEPPSGARIEIDYISCINALFMLFQETALKEKLKPFLSSTDRPIQYQARQAFEHE
jgi:hypothetical protein